MHCADAGTGLSLLDYSAISCLIKVDGLVDATGLREMVDWDKLTATVADEDEGWYESLKGPMAYNKLVFFFFFFKSHIPAYSALLWQGV